MKSAAFIFILMLCCAGAADAAPLSVMVHPLPAASNPASMQPVFVQPVQQEPVLVTRDCGASVSDIMHKAELKVQRAGRTLGGALR
jgi:uncharacterized protein involved in high-affinity Fe2+ transport